MIRTMLWWLLTTAACFAEAQRPAAFFFPPSMTTGNAYQAAFADAASFCVNAAAPAAADRTRVLLSGAMPFGLRDLAVSALALSLRMPGGGIGVAGSWSGMAGYSESALWLGYARSLGKAVSAGVRVSYHATGIAGYGHAATWRAAAGGLFRFSDAWTIGADLGVAAALAQRSRGRPAAEWRAGLAWSASEGLLLTLDLVKTEGFAVSVVPAFFYRIENFFFAGLAFDLTHASPGAVAGWQFGRTRVDIRVAWHPQLGLTPGLSIHCEGKPAAS